jgi:hypothetical protein
LQTKFNFVKKKSNESSCRWRNRHGRISDVEVLAEQKFPYSELLMVASENSVGKQITFQGQTYAVIGLETAVAARPDIAIFSAGGEIDIDDLEAYPDLYLDTLSENQELSQLLHELLSIDIESGDNSDSDIEIYGLTI